MLKLKPSFKNVAGQKSLSFSLLSYILLCSSLLAIIITAIQLLWDYRQDVSQIENSIDQIEISFLESIATSYWNLDQAQVEVQLDGIMRLPNMQYVVVKEILGDALVPLIERGELKKNYDISREFDLVYQGQMVGKLFVAATLDEVYDRIFNKTLLILVTQAIKTFVVSIVILWLIYVLVIRHINKLANYTKNMDLTPDGTPLLLDGRVHSPNSSDELDILTSSINEMREKIIDELEAKKQSNVQLQQERDFSTTIIKTSSTIICCLNEDFTISSINPSGEKITGLDSNKLLGRNWLNLFARDDNKQGIVDKIRSSGKIKDLEIVMMSHAGHLCTLIWNFIPFLQNDELEYYIGFGYDVTDLKEVQAEFKLLNEQLEQKVAERTASLEQSNEQLTNAVTELKQTQDILVESEKMASLGELVAGVAHEVNTPLGVCVTASSFLKEQTEIFEGKYKEETLTENDLVDFLACINDSSDILSNSLNRASELIKSFKQVAVDQSSEASYNFNMAENLGQVIASLHHKIKKASCEVIIDCEKSLNITSYPGSFVQIYSNLIINSVIHGFDDWDGEKKIFISIKKQDDYLYIDYRDTGKGLDPDIAHRIFDPFVTSKRGLGGSGLGTHVVYNLVVQLLKGKIDCNAEVNQGVQFNIVIPYTA
ncbi:ATP-binding protein [Vibrio sp. S4M6]|uniref:ATP-binding protein n=1 Tax=Vibrio sinus TaxID=2946865 RepID=UPI00202A8333|nr:ATP-binding protein [Vibrio sinus]MCL9781338.1 ATP-binding protein [Vibrio sinus]